MKQIKILVAIICIIACLSGCVSQSEYDTLNAQLSELQSDVSEKENLISEKNTKIADLENDVKALEENNKKINDEKTALEKKVDELENGASRLLSDVNNAFESKDYKKTIEVANELHKKFNGSNEDIKAQAVAKQAQAEIDKIEAEKKAEEERKAAEKAKSTEDRIKDIIRIGGVVVDEINSANGVSIKIFWRNESNKDIKYLIFSVTPYNAVGDKVSSSIGGKTTVNCKITGPLPPSATLVDTRLLQNEFFYLSPFGSWEYVSNYNGTYSYSYYDYTSYTSDGYSDFWKEKYITKSDMNNAFQGSYFDCVWYNNTITEIKINKVDIEYMDGTSFTITEDEIKYAMG